MFVSGNAHSRNTKQRKRRMLKRERERAHLIILSLSSSPHISFVVTFSDNLPGKNKNCDTLHTSRTQQGVSLQTQSADCLTSVLTHGAQANIVFLAVFACLVINTKMNERSRDFPRQFGKVCTGGKKSHAPSKRHGTGLIVVSSGASKEEP